ncbi:MAG: peptidase S10 [Phycisphaerales bacterium]|nr:peptidase S10 [Phycisphaerales bacterium]
MAIVRGVVALCVFGVLGLATPLAQAGRPDDDTPAAKDAKTERTTQHTLTIGGRTIAYTATAGYMTLPTYDGKPRAEMFYIAYTLDGVTDPATRPLTFSFNGGPGSSSVWLHLGALGPRRVDMGPEGLDQRPPFALVDNESTWLEFTDLVFIDPVSTGYSRPVEDVRASEFHGYQQDISSVGDFIRLWTTREARWASPKFLCGESYGTTRAAGLSGYLQDTHGMYLSGITLISPILNFQTARFEVGNDEPYRLFLPTYTATAFFHGRLDAALSRDLRATLAEVRAWASTDYLVALAKGDALTGDERARIATTLARYTGLSQAYVEQSDLRIGIFQFTKELLRDQSRTVGRLDSRFKGIDRLDIGSGPEFDPSMSAIKGTYTAAMNDYVRRELGFEDDRVYEILTGRVNPWSYDQFENRYVNVAETLRSAMSQNPSLHVFVASGYYDFATPFFAAESTFDKMQLDESLRGNYRFSYYEAGHMMYIRRADLAQLRADVEKFYRDALEHGTRMPEVPAAAPPGQ